MSLNDFPVRRWRNGRGITREIAAGTAADNAAGIGWRVSLADITEEGAFSLFPGFIRTLGLASEGMLTLTGIRRDACILRSAGETVRFDGAMPVEACCHGRPVRAFNLMMGPSVIGKMALLRQSVTFAPGATLFALPLSGAWTFENNVVRMGMILTATRGCRPVALMTESPDAAALAVTISGESSGLR
ncbi:HutD family protein [Acetobacter oeni]|uniref:Histidine utilization protein HutD n=1 Tax=Acetobacter oeni TaxID=304077 RepID=A0A511XPE8_9PROT|nr:HutD family protein [Acetobacter oeni]MBB3884628.1 hypothetical protein [Acetobacter oeni]GEN64833.1 hypothetical protein AOE01nite_30570 [Acetobacter oeni]